MLITGCNGYYIRAWSVLLHIGLALDMWKVHSYSAPWVFGNTAYPAIL
jgi:hypothetical protein